MKSITVNIVRDPESPDWWLARFTFGGRPYGTQGTIVDEARYMAADLLKQVGAPDDTMVTFAYQDRESLSSLLAHPVTPSLMSDEEAAAEDRLAAEEAENDLAATQAVLAAARS